MSQYTSCPSCNSHANRLPIKMGNYFLFLCSKCGLRFTPEAFNHLPDYNKAYLTEAYIRNQIESLKKKNLISDILKCPTYMYFFKSFKDVSNGLSLLDVGCGVGKFCYVANTLDYNVTGIDISKNAIDIGMSFSNKYKLFNISLDEVILSKIKYDIVVAFEVIEHLSDPLIFLKKIKFVLKNGGKIFVTVPNWDSAPVRKAQNYDALPPYHILYFTRSALYNLLYNAGYNYLNVGYIKTDPFPGNLNDIFLWFARRLICRRRYKLGLYALGINKL